MNENGLSAVIDSFLHSNVVKVSTCEVHHIRYRIILVECSDIPEVTNLYLRNGVFTRESARFSYCFRVVVHLLCRDSVNRAKVYAPTGPISFGSARVHTHYADEGKPKGFIFYPRSITDIRWFYILYYQPWLCIFSPTFLLYRWYDTFIFFFFA